MQNQREQFDFTEEQKLNFLKESRNLFDYFATMGVPPQDQCVICALYGAAISKGCNIDKKLFITSCEEAWDIIKVQ
jgi:hypothetical protein